MFLFTDFDEDSIRRDANAILADIGSTGTYVVSCLHKNSDPGRNQMVFLIHHENGEKFALKKDFKADTRWIEKEYRLFQKLRRHFNSCDHSDVVEPLFLGSDQSFHVTRFVKGRTAADMLRMSDDPKQQLQVFRRAGKWLNMLHHCQPTEPEKIWMNWMITQFDKQLSLPDRKAAPEQYQPFIDK